MGRARRTEEYAAFCCLAFGAENKPSAYKTPKKPMGNGGAAAAGTSSALQGRLSPGAPRRPLPKRMTKNLPGGKTPRFPLPLRTQSLGTGSPRRSAPSEEAPESWPHLAPARSRSLGAAQSQEDRLQRGVFFSGLSHPAAQPRQNERKITSVGRAGFEAASPTRSAQQREATFTSPMPTSFQRAVPSSPPSPSRSIPPASSSSWAPRHPPSGSNAGRTAEPGFGASLRASPTEGLAARPAPGSSVGG